MLTNSIIVTQHD